MPVIQRMTNEELVLDYQSGNKDALEALYSQNIKMIEKIIRRYSGYEELDDLRQEAYFGIVKAAETWNPEKDCSFITYAIYWIRAVIIRYIKEYGRVVRIPSYKRELISRYHKEVNGYYVRFGKYPSDTELRALLELSQEQLEKLKADDLDNALALIDMIGMAATSDSNVLDSDSVERVAGMAILHLRKVIERCDNTPEN